MASLPQMKVSCCHGFLGRNLCQGLALPSLTMVTRSPPPITIVRSSSPLSPVPGGGVSSSMVSASHLHMSTPWLMLTPDTDPITGRRVDRFYSMTDRQIFKLDRKNSLGVPEDARCFGSSRGWIGFIDPNDCSLYLSNPFSDALPSIDSLPSVLGVKRKPSSNSVDKFIMFNYDRCIDYGPGMYYYYEEAEILSRSIVNHLSLSRDPFNYEELEQDCIAMIVQGTGIKKKLAFCRVGREETWTTLTGGSLSYPQTVCPLKSSGMKLFYTMYCDMSGYGIDAWEIPKPSRIPARLANFMYGNSWQLHKEFNFETSELNLRNQCTPKHYLVVDESSGDIMLVTRHTARHVAEDGTIFHLDPSHKQLCKYDYNGCLNHVDPYQVNPRPLPYKTLRFDVYKVDMRKQKLERVQYLGDRAIFLGLNQSFTLSTCEFAGLRRNSIYFTDDCTKEIWSYSLSPGGHDLGIYNLDDNSIEPCYPFSDDLKEDMKIKPPLLWVAPNCYC